MHNILVGIDTGGTRTNVDLRLAEDDQYERTYELSDSLSGSLSPTAYAGTLRKILAPLEGYWPETDSETKAYIFVSSAGFAPSLREDFLDAIMNVVPTILGGSIECFGIANDTVSLLLGHDSDAAVIAGTGSNVMSKSTDGLLHQIGGHGWVSCDYGSGFWIGLRGIRQAYRDCEGAVDSVLLQRLREAYSLRSGDGDRRLIGKLRELAVADSGMKPEVARFAASICHAAARGDVPAQDIVKSEAEELGDMTAILLRRSFTAEELAAGVNILESGSLFMSEFYRSVFEAQVELRMRSRGGKKAELNWRRVDSGRGAAMNLARSLSGDYDFLLQVGRDFRPLIVTP